DIGSPVTGLEQLFLGIGPRPSDQSIRLPASSREKSLSPLPLGCGLVRRKGSDIGSPVTGLEQLFLGIGPRPSDQSIRLPASSRDKPLSPLPLGILFPLFSAVLVGRLFQHHKVMPLLMPLFPYVTISPYLGAIFDEVEDQRGKAVIRGDFVPVEHGGQSAGVQPELTVPILGGALGRRLDQGVLLGVAAIDMQNPQLAGEPLKGVLEVGYRAWRPGRLRCFVRH
ncbi:hypothetical protein ACIA6E_30345, partial [Streptomyces sp. NPDC051815]|uniref:hypothetical protein n=1 Tax=Streptomyces sp. NPDC051815 TaxID=3365674 RepID=UPI0037B47003